MHHTSVTSNSEQLKKLLHVKQHQINSLLEVTKAVNNNYSKAALLRIFEYILRAQLGVTNIALFFRDDQWELEVSHGNEEVANQIDVEEDLLKFHYIQRVTNFPGGKFVGYDILMPVVHKKQPLAYLLVGGINTDQLDSLEEKLKFIETIANIIFVSLENKKLFKKQLEQERLNKEIELAAEVQSMLIPKQLPNNEHFEVSAAYLPHGSIGGDYYDFIELDDNSVAFSMCDVSGKGLSAGMLMANFQANLRALVNREYPLDQMVDMLNHKLYQTTGGDRFITVFVGVYDYLKRELTYVNAGHNPPLLLQGDRIVELNAGSTVLGAFDALPTIEKRHLSLDENTLLLMYTDGLTELENDEDDMYGIDRLKAYIANNNNDSTESITHSLLKELETFKEAKDYNDDISIMCCRFF